MSNEENSNESVDSAAKKVDAVETEATPVVEEAAVVETEAAPMAEEVSAVETETAPAAGAVSKLLGLKQSNPKIFFGGIGAVVLIIIVLMMVGGESKKQLPIKKQANLSIGQSYTLRGVNTYDPMATIRLVAVPGSIAAYDDSAAAEGSGDDKCKHIKQGTNVKLLNVQQAFGNANFVEVEILGGDCTGRKGWASSNNLAP